MGGSTAGYVDLASEISSKLLLQILVVIVLSFLLLVLAFRTVVIPVQAAVMNLLSIGAAYGVLTALFQWGWLHGAIGLDSAVPIVSYVPLFMFAILFGLSMDYEVFLVSQIEEHVHEGQSNRESVVSGLVTSGRVITAAATIMVFVFGSFVLNGDPTVKQFGVGLAVAVILDATVVRCLLVPALMVMVGKANWYLPKWVDRILPRISIEGAEFFEERDRRAAVPSEVVGVGARIGCGSKDISLVEQDWPRARSSGPAPAPVKRSGLVEQADLVGLRRQRDAALGGLGGDRGPKKASGPTKVRYRMGLHSVVPEP